jgi:hypothetical protein
VNSVACVEIPYETEQGFFTAYQGKSFEEQGISLLISASSLSEFSATRPAGDAQKAARPRILEECRCSDRALLVWMTRLWPSLLGMLKVVQPATILQRHRAGFRSYWRWKSRKRAGRPRIDRDLRNLIRKMSRENPLWGAPRIHGGRRLPSQSWRTFPRNHAEAIAAIDLCVVPTVNFERLFAFVIIGHGCASRKSHPVGFAR